MSPRKIHKIAAPLLLAGCLLILSACTAQNGGLFTTVIYVTAPPRAVETPSPDISPSPALQSPEVSPEPVLPPEPAAEPHDYSLPAPETEAVDDSWFSDAAFVGDSRTDGLRIYGGVKYGDFFAYKGLMAQDFDQKACISFGDTKLTPKQALSQKQYGKIYVMLGLNELDFTTEHFAEDYAALIDQIREVQPDAVLYFQSLVPVNDQKCREKKQPHYVTNEKIAQFNAEITRIAQEKQVILVDVSEALTDENGILPYDTTHDGVHFDRDTYKKWFSYLKTHTVDPERLEAAK